MGESKITIPDASRAEQSRLVSSLADELSAVNGVTKVEALRERPETQDPGTILSIALSAPAIVLAVRAIGKWMNRNNQASVTITLRNGNVVMRNMNSEDVSEAIKALTADMRD